MGFLMGKTCPKCGFKNPSPRDECIKCGAELESEEE